VSAIVDLTDVGRVFGAATVLGGIDLSIAAGEFVALIGRSGAGKSTLLRLLAGLDRASTGTVRLPERRAVVFQEPRLMPWKRVIDNVRLGLRRPDAAAAARAALADVGLADRARAWPATLSGGEAQRAGLARALVRTPELLLLDEPFASLDALTRLQMQELVADLWRRARPAVLLVTHDVWEAVALADRVLVLERGHFVAEVEVALPRPRRRTDPRVAALEQALLARLGVEPPEPPSPPSADME
jgi:sulfonate transport system ATP-binding protein